MQRLPLEEIRIIDFTTALAGPDITRWLGVMGAEIINVESSLHLDFSRLGTVPGRPAGPDQIHAGT
ncbi:CoA transferase [Thermodesulfobacteriota bacterium]